MYKLNIVSALKKMAIKELIYEKYIKTLSMKTIIVKLDLLKETVIIQ